MENPLKEKNIVSLINDSEDYIKKEDYKGAFHLLSYALKRTEEALRELSEIIEINEI